MSNNFENIPVGAYTITGKYNYSYPLGGTAALTDAKTANAEPSANVTVSLLFDGCPPKGSIVAGAYIDKNCNNNPDRLNGEIINSSLTYIVSGPNYNRNFDASNGSAQITDLLPGTYSITANYGYTFPDGKSKELEATATVLVNSAGTFTTMLRFNGCYTPPPPPPSPVEKGLIVVTSYLDKNCNGVADQNEILNAKHKVVLSGSGYRKTNYPSAAISTFYELQFGTYTAEGEYDFVAADKRSYGLKASSVVTVDALKGANTSLLFSPCNIKIDTVPAQPEIPKDVCGRWISNLIQTSTTAKVTGSNVLTNSRDPLVIGLLKTTVNFNGSYKWFWEKYSGECNLSGTIVFPDGTRSNWSNSFGFEVRQTGTYTVSYQVKCQDRICESGVKTIISTDVVVCNCGPTNQTANVLVGKGKSRRTMILRSGDSLILDKSERFAIDYQVNCTGNICDPTATYDLVNALNQTVKTGLIGAIDFKRLIGNYTLRIYGRCGGKNCADLSFPVRIYGVEKAEIISDARCRWGNQIGVNFGWPDFERMSLDKNYIGGLFGIIGDIPFGAKKRLHLWPALNLATARYRGSENITSPVGTKVAVDTRHFMFRLGMDLSYAFPLNNKGANFHIYGGFSADGRLWSKQNVTATPSSYLNTWNNNNKSDSAQRLSPNVNLGILVDLNRTYTIGVNYFFYGIDQNKNIYTPLSDRGVSVRFAWFYNKERKPEMVRR